MSDTHRNGLVISDLHLVTNRTRGEAWLEDIYRRMADAQVVVLNGDTFDFEWTTEPTIEAGVDRAMEWLQGLVDRFPDKSFHFIFGNHDYHVAFNDRLYAWAQTVPRFHVHEIALRLGPNLFLHGDCANYMMTPKHLDAVRARTKRMRRHSAFLASILYFLDWIGWVKLLHVVMFPRQATCARLLHFLQRLDEGMLNGVTDIYFGHTHIPFASFEHAGYRFHNTGCGLLRMEFQPHPFSIVDN